MKYFLSISLLVLLFCGSLLPGSAGGGGIAGTEQVTAMSGFEEIEKEALKLINEYRAGKGLDSLAYNEELSRLARNHSYDMAAGNVSFGHKNFDARTDSFGKGSKYGENVCGFSGSSYPAQRILGIWKSSPGHNRNMLSRFDIAGIGVVKSSEGDYYATLLMAAN